MKQAKCYNCKHGGEQFKINKLTHLHCEHPKHKKAHEDGTLSPWDTLCVFSESCQDHEFKQPQNTLENRGE